MPMTVSLAAWPARGLAGVGRAHDAWGSEVTPLHGAAPPVAGPHGTGESGPEAWAQGAVLDRQVRLRRLVGQTC